ncbi:hemerythrin domain-containing protein [Nocardioides sp. Kera G14]|uniref:hemerythrin domain-containing protein n=1 Tax=Nocardioides sp. Kera G14 TaxID=2884264 RepID=UPI001D0FB071|nr:hemerythrin domain-containing protein [Nocardioides sp. Kera G14]UDY24655.1 hemerythrin domain-containing protein [Nocardioides sp. Kera G14]
MDTDVVDLIMKDHRELEQLFDELLNFPDKRANLLPVMTTLLTAHSRAEEAEVYPKAAEAGGADDVEHSQEEHLLADELALKLTQMPPDSPDFPAALKALVDAVTHHVQEEEEKVLPGMRENMDSAVLSQLGEAFLSSRAEHLGEQPEDKTKEQMLIQADNADISGVSGQSKSELEKTLSEHADK